MKSKTKNQTTVQKIQPRSKKSKKLIFSNNFWSTKPLLFIVFFALIGTLFLVKSFAADTLFLTSNNLDIANSIGATVIKDTSSPTKGNSNVVQIENSTSTTTAKATLVDLQVGLDTGIYKACLSSFSIDGSVNGKLQIVEYANSSPTNVIGEASFIQSIKTDYSEAICVNFTNSSSNVWISTVVHNNSSSTSLRIGNINIVKVSDLPNSLPRPANMTQRSFKITVSGSTQEVFYWSNGSVETPDSNVRRLVFVIHGNSRNADDYGRYATEAANLAGADPTTNTLIVAPHFVADVDISSANNTRMYWSESGWKEGSLSKASPYTRLWRMSSFEVLDRMIQTAKNTFPNVNSIVVIGHSAGGQFANRYAAGTGLPEQITNVDFRFVSANPSSYLYLDNRRLKSGVFTTLNSSEISSCSGYNIYKYGMAGMNSYLNNVGATNISNRFKLHKVYYLLGDQDITNNNSLDTSCSANWQGPYRLHRGNNYYDYLSAYYGSVPSSHKKLIVPGVAHDGRAMITSDQGRQATYSP